MRNLKIKNKKIIFIGLVIFLSITSFGYLGSEGDNKFAKEVVPHNKDNVAIELLTVLNELDKIDIDVDFFKEDISHEGNNLISFNELYDFSRYKVAEKPKGKVNPFLSPFGRSSLSE